jgi:hypothetical protein
MGHSPSTPRGIVALPSGGSPIIASLYSSPDWVSYSSLSPFASTMAIPRSDPTSNSGLRYPNTPVSTSQLPMPDGFQFLNHEPKQSHGNQSSFGQVYHVADAWDGLLPNCSGSQIDSLHSVERTSPTVGDEMFTLSQDSCFPIVFADDGNSMPFLADD